MRDSISDRDSGSPEEPSSLVGGGNASYRGYDYQKEVTVWTALSLMLGVSQRPLNELIVEPASHDDIEARLDVPAEDAETSLALPETLLTVQIKFRGSGHWSSEAFAGLVKDKMKRGSRGPAPRPRAKSMLLAEPTRRYILVTNVSVDQALSGARIARLDEAPDPDFLPTGVADDAHEKAALTGRFGVIETLTSVQLRAEIRRLLEEVGHVPSPRIAEAIEGLKRAVEDRLLGLALPLTRNEVEAILQSTGGLPHASPELAEYEAPPAALTAEEILAAENAVLLVGPPGYGKSLTAKHLVYKRRLANPPFQVVRENVGVSGIDEALQAPGRHVFYLDDPWGQSKLEEDDAYSWNIELPRLLRRATADKQFIITSRSDILRLAIADTSETPWSTVACPITDVSYDEETRWRLLMKKLRGSASWQEDLSHQHRAALLQDLRSPLALDRFAKALLRCKQPQTTDLRSLIEGAQVESIKRIVAEQVRGWPEKGVASATILWALLRRGGRVDPPRLSELRRELERGVPPVEINLEGFVDHFRPVSLREEEDGQLSTHGKVVEAMELIAIQHRVEAERTLDRMALALERLSSSDHTFADELLRTVDAANSVANNGIRLSADVVSKVDAMLLGRLVAASNRREFSTAFQDVVYRTSEKPALARLCRYLERGEPKPPKTEEQSYSFDFGWRPPPLSETELDIIRSEPNAKRVLAGFIAFRLPLESEDYDANKLLPWLQQFGFNLRSAFVKACQVMARETHFLVNADTVVEGALVGLEPPYETVFELIEGMDQAVTATQAQRNSTIRAWQGELDYWEQLRLQDDLEDEGSAVPKAVAGYVRTRRRAEGYKWISNHKRPDLLLPAWAEVMNYEPPAVTSEEIQAFFDIASNASLRERGLRIIGERRLEAERPRLLKALRIGTPGEQQAAVTSLDWLDGEDRTELAVGDALADVSAANQVNLLYAGSERGFGKRGRCRIMRRLRGRAPLETKDLLELASLAQANAPADRLLAAFRRLPPGQVLEVIDAAPSGIGRLLLSLSAHEGRDVTLVCERWLASEEELDIQAALDALARVGTPDARKQIADALEHPAYKVRRFAMEQLSIGANVQEVGTILKRAEDPSAPVRERLAELIGRNQWHNAETTLLTLLGDTRDYARHQEYGARPEMEFRVARAAAAALKCFGSPKGPVLHHLLNFLSRGEAASADIELHGSVVTLLADVEDDRVVPLLGHLLNDDRVIGETGEDLYPVRYAAAWMLYHQLQTHPLRQAQADWRAIERAAGHIDPQLAAPGLCLLGLRLDPPIPEALSVLRAPNTSLTRRALTLLGIDDIQKVRDLVSKFNVLPPDHPLVRVDTSASISADTALAPWPVTAELDCWLRSLDPSRDVEGVILKLAAARTGLDLGVESLDATSLRRPPRMPIITLSEMFGME